MRYLSDWFKKLSIDDKIVFVRLVVGLLFGLVTFLISIFVPSITLSPFAWSSSIIIYYFTGLYLAVKYGPLTRFQLYIRGLGTFYGVWLTTSIVLYELMNMLRG